VSASVRRGLEKLVPGAVTFRVLLRNLEKRLRLCGLVIGYRCGRFTARPRARRRVARKDAASNGTNEGGPQREGGLSLRN